MNGENLKVGESSIGYAAWCNKYFELKRLKDGKEPFVKRFSLKEVKCPAK